MKRSAGVNKLIVLGVLVLCNILQLKSNFLPSTESETKRLKQAADAWMKQNGVKFIENKGQLRDVNYQAIPWVLFKAEANGLDLYITEKGLNYVFFELKEEEDGDKNESLKRNKIRGIEEEKVKVDFSWINLSLVGANIKKENIIKEKPSTYFKQFFLSHCAQGITDVRDYEKVTIKDVYPGIDWVFYNSNEKGFKYDFIVHPGANPSQIKMLYDSEKELNMDAKGNIHLKTKIGELTEEAPYSYTQNENKSVASSFKVVKIDKHKTEVSFNIDSFNHSSTLVIDPQLKWATFFSGNMSEGPYSIEADNSGNFYVTGYSNSTTFPLLAQTGSYNQTLAADIDIFILKFNTACQLLWSTFYGGTGSDNGSSIVVDALNNVYITGATYSTNFPLQNVAGAYNQAALGGGFMDAYIVKFNSAGVRQWATYYGGSSQDVARSLDVDINGNVYMVGATKGNFPLLNLAGAYNQAVFGGAQWDAFIVKFDNLCARKWATYYGGSGIDDAGYVTSDGLGNVYVAGSTNGNFPLQAMAGAYNQSVFGGGFWDGDAFFIKFNSSGARLWSTYFGGVNDDHAYALGTDASNNLFVLGQSASPNLPLQVLAGAYNQTFGGVGMFNYGDAFILKFNSSNQLVWSTFYGGSSDEYINSPDNLAIDACGNLYISLLTYGNMPTQVSTCLDYDDNTYNGNANKSDQFVAKFSNVGVLKWDTYFGGDGSDHRAPIAADQLGNLFLGGEWTQVGSSSSYPTLNPGGGAFFNGNSTCIENTFVAKFSTTPPTYLSAQQNPSACTCNGTASISIVTCGEPPYSYQWSNNFSQLNVTNTISSISGLCAGVYQVTVTSSCNFTQTTSFTLINSNSNLTANFVSFNANCNATTGSVTVNSITNGVANYTVAEGTNTLLTNVNTPFNLTNISVGAHVYVITDANGCSTTINVNILQNGLPNITVNTPIVLTCAAPVATLTGNSTTSGVNFLWLPQNVSTKTLQVSGPGNYTFVVTDPTSGCTSSAVVNVTQNGTLPNISILQSGNINCSASTVTLTGNSTSAGVTFSWSPQNVTTNTAIVTTPGNYSFTVIDAGSGCRTMSVITIFQNLSTPVFNAAVSNSINCIKQTATLSAVGSGISFIWNGGSLINSASPATVSAGGNYTLTATDVVSGCKSTSIVTVVQNTLPQQVTIITHNKLEGCEPLCVSFSVTSQVNNSNQFLWTFTNTTLQDPNTSVYSSDANPTICFKKAGVYNGSLKVFSADGCSVNSTFSANIIVHQKPIANFEFSPQQVSILEPEVSFINQSSGANSYVWNNVNDIFSYLKNPKYVFQDPGKYLITLIASNGFCSDTVSKYIDVEDEFDIKIPNTFTPDGDNLNDFFFPVMRGFSEKNFKLMVFDRWGEKIFQTGDPRSKGWDGTYKGQICKDDVYVWKLNVTTNRGVVKDMTGHVTLIK